MSVKDKNIDITNYAVKQPGTHLKLPVPHPKRRVLVQKSPRCRDE